MKEILAEDIGGTNSRFGYFRFDRDDTLVLVGTKWLPTAGADSSAHPRKFQKRVPGFTDHGRSPGENPGISHR